MPPVAAFVAVASVVASTVEQKRAARKQRAASAIEQRVTAINNDIARKRAVSTMISQQSSIRAKAAASGLGEGSSVPLGEAASFASQTAFNIGQQLTQERAGQASAALLQDASKSTERAATFQAVGQLPGQVGLDTSFASLFEKAQPPTPTK